jgi:multiple sugar transport system substrate-binding protein
MRIRRSGSASIIALSLLVTACSGNQGSSTAPSAAATESAPASSGASESAAPSESAGASGGASESAGASGGATIQASGSINAFGMSYDTGDTIAKERVDYFKEKYPDVKVKFSESGFDPQQFVTALQSSDPPDVVSVERWRIGTYVGSGVLEPLDDCISKAGVDMSNYRDSAVKAVTFNGKVYGMPQFFWVSNWLVDDDLFKQAGLDPANWDVSNWDQISAANDALLSKTKTKIGIDPKSSDNGDRFPMWVAAAGGSLLSDDGKTAQLDSQPVVDALTFAKKLIDAHGGLTKFKDKLGQTGDFFGAENEFKNNLEGAFPMQQWYLNVLAGATPDTKFTVVPFKSKQGQPVTMAEGDALAITANSKNKDAACAFITAMTSTDAWIRAATKRASDAKAKNQIQTGTSTGNKAAEDQIFNGIVDTSGNQVFTDAVKNYYGTFDSAFELPATTAAEDFRQAWIDGVNAALSGQKDPATAMKDAQTVAQQALDSAPQAP